MSVVGSVKEFVLKVVGDYLVINVPEWAEIGKLIEFKMYDQSCGKERWFRERIISYVYYNRFSDLGTVVRLCEQKYDYDTTCGLDE